MYHCRTDILLRNIVSLYLFDYSFLCQSIDQYWQCMVCTGTSLELGAFISNVTVTVIAKFLNLLKMISLAAETKDAIIDFLHDDTPSLCSCSLTCKAFVPSARYHLFSNIVFTSNTIEPFTTLLGSPSPSNLVQVVQCITLRRLGVSDIPAVSRLTAKLRAVTSLLIDDNSGFVYLSPRLRNEAFEVVLPMLMKFSEVEELSLRNMWLERFDQALDLAYIFPKLRWLSLENLSVLHDGITKFRDGPHFNLRTVPWGDVAEWLLSRNPMPTIQRLELFMQHFQSTGFYCVLEHLGRYVSDLRIALTSTDISSLSCPLLHI